MQNSKVKTTKIKSVGWLKFITGPMFAGKTSHLIKEIRYYKSVLRKKILIFKPILDVRFKNSQDRIVNHNFLSHPTVVVNSNQEILDFITQLKIQPEIIFFDEIHLFPAGFTQIIVQLQKKGINLVCSGLSKDFRKHYFSEVDAFLKLQPKVKQLYANCFKCFQPATNSQRLVKEDSVILVGGKKLYAPVCDRCFVD